MTVRRFAACVMVVGLMAPACNWLTPLIFVGEHKKRILPEFDKLAGRRVAVLVWTEPATLFDYPYARLELATYLADKLQTETTQRQMGTDVVSPRDVEEFLQKTPGADVDPYAVGRRFKADYVIFVEVVRFQIRDPQQPQFVQGQLEAGVSVHDMQADPGQTRRIELAPVTCTYPPDQPLLLSRVNAPVVREETYRVFAELVARKFYEYSVDL